MGQVAQHPVSLQASWSRWRGLRWTSAPQHPSANGWQMSGATTTTTASSGWGRHTPQTTPSSMPQRELASVTGCGEGFPNAPTAFHNWNEVDIFWNRSALSCLTFPASSLCLTSPSLPPASVSPHLPCLQPLSHLTLPHLPPSSLCLASPSLTLPHLPPSSLLEPGTGHQVRVYTDRPGVQLYTGNFLDGSLTGKGGKPIEQHGGVCLETQAWPNAINNPVGYE